MRAANPARHLTNILQPDFGILGLERCVWLVSWASLVVVAWWPVTTDDGTSKDSILKINTMKAINQAHYFTNLCQLILG